MAALKEHNEGSTVEVDVSFFDANGDAVVPSEAKYQVDDEASGQNIVALGNVPGALAASMVIEIPPDKNQMIAGGKKQQVRIVTVRFKYGSGKQGAERYRYVLNDLPGTLLP